MKFVSAAWIKIVVINGIIVEISTKLVFYERMCEMFKSGLAIQSTFKQFQNNASTQKDPACYYLQTNAKKLKEKIS